MKMYRRTLLAAGLASGLVPLQASRAQVIEKRDVSVSIGSWIIQYLPLPVAVAQNYFKDEKLNVTVNNFDAGGSKALQALLGGSTDLVVGFFDHTIQMQVQGKEIRAVILLNQIPGIVLAARKDLAGDIHSVADLKGRRVGITALGSSSEFQVRYMAARAGLKPDDLTLIPVGSDATAIAAIEHKAVDALNGNDPAITVMQQRGLIDILVDARTTEGADKAFGGKYPTSVLYTTEAFIKQYPGTVQHVVNAFARSLRCIHDSTPEQLAAMMPKEFVVGDMATFTSVLGHAKPVFPVSGRFNEADLLRSKDVVASFNPKVAAATIDIGRTYTNRFVDAAPAA
jgi:NitT/TauT family transport system substrate-binding protein